MTARFPSKSIGSFTLVPPASNDGTLACSAYGITAVQQLLGPAIAEGSDEAVVRTFVGAVARFEGLKARAYVRTNGHSFDLQVARPGEWAPRSSSLWLEGLRADSKFFRLSAREILDLDLYDGPDVLMARVGDRSVRSWLLIFSGVLPESEDARVQACIAALEQALLTGRDS